MNHFRELFRIGIFWGFWAGLACCVYLVVLALLHLNPFGPFKYIYLSVYGLFFGLAMFQLRRKMTQVHFLYALVCSIALNLTATLLFFISLWGISSTSLMQEGISIYKSDLERFMAETRQNIIQTEGYNEFTKKYMVREGLIYRGRIQIDSTENQLIEFEGNKIFDTQHKHRHDDFLNQIPQLKTKDIAIDQALGLSFAGFLLSFVFSLFFKNATIGMSFPKE